MATYECPTCRETFTALRIDDAPYRPFCSDRCKMVDLGRWLDGSFKISEPVSLEELDQDETEPNN